MTTAIVEPETSVVSAFFQEVLTRVRVITTPWRVRRNGCEANVEVVGDGSWILVTYAGSYGDHVVWTDRGWEDSKGSLGKVIRFPDPISAYQAALEEAATQAECTVEGWMG